MSCFAAAAYTVAAWFLGMFIDVNLDFGSTQGFMCLRLLFPLIAMGLCVMKTVRDGKK